MRDENKVNLSVLLSVEEQRELESSVKEEVEAFLLRKGFPISVLMKYPIYGEPFTVESRLSDAEILENGKYSVRGFFEYQKDDDYGKPVLKHRSFGYKLIRNADKSYSLTDFDVSDFIHIP
jgi:hypothetical protein